jgi:hypothetical protein
MQQVVSLKNAVDAQKKAVEMAELSHKRITELKKSNIVPEAEVQQSEALLAKAKADLAKLEADLAIPLGRLPGKYETVDLGASSTSQGWETFQGLATGRVEWQNGLPQFQWNYPGQWTPQAQWQRNLNTSPTFAPYVTGGQTWNSANGWSGVILSPSDASMLAGASKNAPGSMADKIRLALDKPIKIASWKGPMPLEDVIEFLRKKAETDVPFRLLMGDHVTERIDLMDGELPLGAWLQAVEDSIPHLVIVMRDYGILITTRERAPENVEPIRNFWHRARATEKAKDPEKVATPPKAK